ncbi:MAG: hypothetical protein IT359_07000 [Gemmatimonadaceae bacterium]|nr:hypothetical protein [Gemmatimonadaceae bacterium]
MAVIPGPLARASAVLLLAGALAVPVQLAAQRAVPAALDTLTAPRAAPAPAPGAPPDAAPQRKSPGVAAALGMVPGVGHLYAGEVNRGWLLMAAYWTGYLMVRGGRTDTVGKVGGVVVVGGWLFSVVDGANAARRYNARAQGGAATPSSPRS